MSSKLPPARSSAKPYNVRSACAIDVETTGASKADTADPRRAEFVCAAVANDTEKLITFDPPRIEPTGTVIVWNVPYDNVVLRTWDCHIHDGKMLAHMGGEVDTTLKGLSLRYLDRPLLTYPEAERLGVLPEYCLGDAQATWDLYPILRDVLDKSVVDLYDALEAPLFPLWTKMTLEGSFYLDRPGLLAYEAELADRVSALRLDVEDALPRGRDVRHCSACGLHAIRKETGQTCEGNLDEQGRGGRHKWVESHIKDEPVNLNSPAQLLEALESLGIPVSATNADELEGWLLGGGADQYPVLRTILDYRAGHKELSTSIRPWLTVPEGERLGCIWNPHGTWTMRVSSRGPNLMNVPNHLWRFFHGGEGHTLLTFDHAQLEVRLAAHFSEDPVMMEACRTEDVHATFQKLLGLDDRRLTKIFVFGTLYGGGTDAFDRAARKFGLVLDYRTLTEADRMLRLRFRHYFEWAREMSERRHAPGLFGMIHRVPPGGSEHHQGREMVNALPQGGGGLVTKFGMLALHRAGYEVVGQVHDSITVRVPDAFVEEVRQDVPRIMETAIPHPLSVPLKVEVK